MVPDVQNTKSFLFLALCMFCRLHSSLFYELSFCLIHNEPEIKTQDPILTIKHQILTPCTGSHKFLSVSFTCFDIYRTFKDPSFLCSIACPLPCYLVSPSGLHLLLCVLHSLSHSRGILPVSC